MSVLRYNRFDEAFTLPRYELRHGRNLYSGGILSGALHTLGYYSTDLCLGSPPRRYELIIDTGSSITAVPCSSCKACGTHQCGVKGRFDVKWSTTAKPVDCRSNPELMCESCSANQCSYSVHYTEGSAIKGYVVRDVVQLVRSGVTPEDDMTHSLPVFFGCQTLETGMFFRQEADGILGLQPPRYRSRIPNILSSLSASQSAVDGFSLCLSDSSGLFLMGGSAQRSRPGAIVVPMEHGAKARYSLKLAGVSVSKSGPGNHSFTPLALPQSVFSPTIVDSGTTFVYVSSALFRALHLHLKAQVPLLERTGSKVCASMSTQQLDSMPSINFVFAEHRTPLLIRPNQYMVEFPKRYPDPSKRHYCVGIFDNHAGGTVATLLVFVALIAALAAM